MRMYEDYLPPVLARRKRDEEPKAQPQPATRPSWQSVGLPGSDGWLSRMQQRGPDGRAEVMSELQQTTGNRNVSRALARTPSWSSLWDTFTDVGSQLIDQAMCFTLGGTVGAGGKNEPADVQHVRARLKSLGYPTTDGGDSLTHAIKSYQSDVVGLKKPDGRIDPGGKTLAKLNAGATAAKTDAASPTSPTTPAAPTSPATPAPEASDAATPEATPESSAPTTTTGPSVAPTSASKGLKAVYDELDRLRTLHAAAEKRAEQLDAAAYKAAKDAKKAKDKAAEGAAEFGIVNTQETGKERDDLVRAIGDLRRKIDALTPSEAGLSDADLKKTKAALWRDVARLAPFYYQITNADVLFSETYDKKAKAWKYKKHGGQRTCNVTSLSMTLEALGKSAADYKGADKHILPYIYAHFSGRLDTSARDRVTKDLDGLRMPDFLQLLVIVKCMPKEAGAELAQKDPAAFGAIVDEARRKASDMILQSGKFEEIVGSFGVEVSNEYPFAKMSVGGVDYAEIIDRIGEINRSNIPDVLKDIAAKAKKSKDKLTAEEQASAAASVAKYWDEDVVGKHQALGTEAKLAEKEKELEGADKKSKKKIEGEIKKLKGALGEQRMHEGLAKLGINKAAADPKALDKIIPISVYAEKVAAALNAHLDAGHQIVGHMHGHFFRVESVEDWGVVIDDPGKSKGRNARLTWHEARSVGCFTRFTWVKPK